MTIKQKLKKLITGGLVIASLYGTYQAGSSTALNRARSNLLEAYLNIHSLENSMELTPFEERHLETYGRILNDAAYKILDSKSPRQDVEDMVKRELEDVEIERQLYCK